MHEVARKCAANLVLLHSGRCGCADACRVVRSGNARRRAHGFAVARADWRGKPLLLVAASTMLYVAIVELVPAIRPGVRVPGTPRQTAFMLPRIVRMSATHRVAYVRS